MTEAHTERRPKLRISRDHLLMLLEKMLRIRHFEEKCAELYTLEKIRGFLHLYVGEEAVATGVTHTLQPDDAVVATYREHGHALLRGIPMGRVLAEMYGKVEGCSRGRGGSMHLFDANARFFGGMPLSPAACRWQWVWRWPINWPGATM